MAESDVVRVAREYREQLARNEDAALKRMAKYWVGMEKRLTAEYQALAQEVIDRMARGEAVPRQYIYTMERYRSMMEQIQKEMPDYQATTENLIKEYQRKDYILGIDGANEIIKASQPDSMLLQTDYGADSERILDALVSGVGLGKGYKEVAKMMADAMTYDYDRAMRIARTEINRSYRLANAEQYRRSGVVEKVIRLCYKPTACFACLMMDGEECPNGICDDHPNGKCTTIVQTTGGIVPEWEKGPEWFEKQDEEDRGQNADNRTDRAHDLLEPLYDLEPLNRVVDVLVRLRRLDNLFHPVGQLAHPVPRRYLLPEAFHLLFNIISRFKDAMRLRTREPAFRELRRLRAELGMPERGCRF